MVKMLRYISKWTYVTIALPSNAGHILFKCGGDNIKTLVDIQNRKRTLSNDIMAHQSCKIPYHKCYANVRAFLWEWDLTFTINCYCRFRQNAKQIYCLKKSIKTLDRMIWFLFFFAVAQFDVNLHPHKFKTFHLFPWSLWTYCTGEHIWQQNKTDCRQTTEQLSSVWSWAVSFSPSLSYTHTNNPKHTVSASVSC